MAAVSDADYKPCPHCGRELHKWVRAKHVRACPLRPEIADALRAALTGPTGCAMTAHQYEDARSAQLPTHIALLRSFGSWRAVCAHFGLTPLSASAVQCRHCGRVDNVRAATRHAKLCPLRPEIADALRAALISPDDGCLASRNEYTAVRTPDLPRTEYLERHFGGWSANAPHFGLPVRDAAAARRRRAVGLRDYRAGRGQRKKWVHTPQPDPLLVGAVRVREDYGDGDGLAVAGVRQMGGRTVYMLR